MRLGRCVAVLLVLAACGGGGTPPDTAPPASVKTFASTDLPKLVLTSDERPKGTQAEEREEVTLDDFWSCCKDQREKFSGFGYEGGYRAGFQAPSLPETVGRWPAGVVFAKSVVALFGDARGASAAIPIWRGYFESSVRGKVTKLTPNLGDESSGIAGVFFKDEQQMFIYFWRVGNVVLHVRIGGRSGTIQEEAVAKLAAAMQARAAEA